MLRTCMQRTMLAWIATCVMTSGDKCNGPKLSVGRRDRGSVHGIWALQMYREIVEVLAAG